MTRRRIIEPGTTWALSRRTTRRHFLLNPDQARELERCYWYCLGMAIPEQMEGLSLKTLITGQGPKPALPEYIVTETQYKMIEKLGVYSDSWKYFENLDGHKGTAPREIQAKGGNENGAATNKLAEHTAEAAAMEAYLRSWKATHPEAKRLRAGEGLSKENIEQLKALGYLK
jgi:hypothetical protein